MAMLFSYSGLVTSPVTDLLERNKFRIILQNAKKINKFIKPIKATLKKPICLATSSRVSERGCPYGNCWNI